MFGLSQGSSADPFETLWFGITCSSLTVRRLGLNFGGISLKLVFFRKRSEAYLNIIETRSLSQKF